MFLCPELAEAYLGKRRKLTVRIFLEVCLDQRRVFALADRFPKRQFDFPVLRVAHADSVFGDRFEANAGERREAALRILLEIGFVLARANAVFDRIPELDLDRL